uniref:Uncharacterized protein n=1 Tax=Tetranychus urticae TaxID=32264 RepID=T1K835_TETUR
MTEKIARFLNGKSLIWFICFSGCSYQLFNLTYRFISWESRTDTIHRYPEVVLIPEIDFYFPLGTLLHMNAVYKRYPDEIASLCMKLFGTKNVTINSVSDFDEHCSALKEAIFSSDVFLSKVLTIGDIEELTEDPRPFIKAIYSLDTKQNYLETKVCNMSRHLNAGGIFMRITCRNDSKPLSYAFSHGSGGNNFLIYLEHTIDTPFGFRFSNHDDPISHHTAKYEFMKKSTDVHYTIITYFHRQVESVQDLLGCSNYNRMNVLFECLNSTVQSSSPFVFYDAIISFGTLPRNTKFIDPYDEPTGQFFNLFKSCTELIVKPRCDDVDYYTTFQVFHDQVLVQSPRQILIDTPNAPDRILVTSLKMTLDSLMYSCYSILGIWFGFSVCDKWTQWNAESNCGWCFCCCCLSKLRKRKKSGSRKRAPVSQLKIIREIETDSS